jgi:hypothetical protein
VPDEQITPREYWRGRWQWAKANTKLWTADKFVSGPIVAVIALALQWKEGIRLMIPTVQIAITVVGAYGIVLFGSLLMNLLYHAPVALERERSTTISERDSELTRIRKEQEAPPGGYSAAEMQRLARYHLDGNELFNVHISPNVAHPQRELEKWGERYDEWREKILNILHPRDMVTFQALHTAGDETVAMAGGVLNYTHGSLRGRLYAELKRLEKIMNRSD